MTYSVRAFADLAGVTVKTLHYYERRGLLAPRRTHAGYRRYTLKDLAQLERIIALKKLGLPLKQTARVKPASLAAHKDRLLEKQRLVAEAIAACDAVARASDPEAALRKFVGESTWARYEARRAEMSSPVPRAPDRASSSRFALFHEIKDALDRDPSGESANALVARWHALIEVEAKGNPQTIAAMRKISATRATWPDGARRYVASLYDVDVDTWGRVMTFVNGAACT